MSSFMKGNRMYNGRQIAIGSSGRSYASELIARGRQNRTRQLRIGNIAGMVSPCGISNTPTCAPPVNVCPENQKRYVMPFEPSSGYTATVAAAATTVWQGKPQKLFKPDRLIIASTIAPYFNVTDFRIANIPQTLSAGAVAADIYSEVSTYTEMSFDQAYPGIDVILTAVNKSSVTQTFQAQLIGWLVG